MIKYSFSILLMGLLTTTGVINASGERASKSMNPHHRWRDRACGFEETPHFMPSHRSVSSNNSPNGAIPSNTVINNYYGKKKDSNGGLTNGQKAAGVAGILAGTITVCKYIWSYVEFGQQAVDVGQQAINLQKEQQKIEEKRLQQEAMRTQAQNEANDLNREFSDEAHEAHSALQGLSITQLHLLAVSEAESGSQSTYFRKRYEIALLALRNSQQS